VLAQHAYLLMYIKQDSDLPDAHAAMAHLPAGSTAQSHNMATQAQAAAGSNQRHSSFSPDEHRNTFAEERAKLMGLPAPNKSTRSMRQRMGSAPAKAVVAARSSRQPSPGFSTSGLAPLRTSAAAARTHTAAGARSSTLVDSCEESGSTTSTQSCDAFLK